MASEQLSREDVVEKQEQSLEKARLGDSVGAHTGVVTRIATHFESLHDEIASDFPFSPTNQLSVSSSSSSLGRGHINNNNGVVEEGAGKKEELEVAASGSPTYRKLADAVGRTSQYLSERAKPVVETLSEKTHLVKETLTNTIAANSIIADEQTEAYANNNQATTESPKYAAQNAKELISSAAESVKDTTIDTAKKVSSYVGETAVMAEKAAVDVGSYVGEKAAVAKDAALVAGINAVVFSEKLAVKARDRALVAGWGVAHYTVDVAGSAAGFIEGKTEGSRGAVGSYVNEKATAAKEATADVEEFTARKKAGAEREMEAHDHMSSNDEPSSLEHETRN